MRGGRVAEIGGLWYEPTLVEPRTNDSEIVQREVFGPVLTFQTFATRTRRSRSPTRREYGLAGDRLHVLARSARSASAAPSAPERSGSTRFLVRDLTAPFGGVGISGIGREGGDYALDFYSDLKTLQILEDTTG